MINIPLPHEYPPFAAGYVALAIGYSNLGDTLNELSATTPALITQLHAQKGNYSYAAGKWTLKQVLLHIIDTERVFAYRLLCVARAEQQNLPGFEQDDYVANSEADRRELADLIDEYKAVRQATLCLLYSLSTAQADRTGSANNNKLSARAVAHIILGHELHHVKVLKEKYS